MDIDIIIIGNESRQENLFGEMTIKDLRDLKKQLDIGSAEGYTSEIGNIIVEMLERSIRKEDEI